MNVCDATAAKSSVSAGRQSQQAGNDAVQTEIQAWDCVDEPGRGLLG